MGKRIQLVLQLQIRRRLEAGENPADIWRKYHGSVSKQTIYTMRINLDLWGELYKPATVILGRPRTLLPIQEQVSDDIRCGAAVELPS